MRQMVTERPAMRDYGVPDGPEGLLSWAWAESRLEASRNYWVVTASPEGRPHAMPVWGVWRGDAAEFWFSCAPSARKAANLRANPQMTVAADDTVEVVSVEGVARAVTDPTDLAPALGEYVRKYAEPGHEEELAGFVGSHPWFAMTAHRAFGIIEREDEFATSATRWRWIP